MKRKYQVELPRSKEILESLLQTTFKKNANKHLIIRIFKTNISLENLVELITKYHENIEQFRKNMSMVILSDDFNYEDIPNVIPIAPTEEEAIDIIDFEEIEKEIMLNKNY